MANLLADTGMKHFYLTIIKDAVDRSYSISINTRLIPEPGEEL
jgi:hypothetical protein